MLCEVLVTLLIKGIHEADNSATLRLALSKDHPERESAFVTWAMQDEHTRLSSPAASYTEQLHEERI